MSSLSRATEVLQVKRLSDSATLPVRGSEWAAGFDLSSAHDVVIPSRGKALVKTDLSIAIPRNTYARIAPRSGLALKKHIDVGAGVVDYDYRGPVGVVLFNHASEDFEVRKGDRIAQMILERICMADVVEVDTLPETTRGAGGFGSTGVDLANKLPSPNGKRLRHDMDLEDADAEVSVGGRLLVFLNELSKTYPEESALCKALKPLALAEDKRLVAALEAFRATADQDDLFHTLKVICPNGADTTIDTN